jgi:hypothetical protein
MRGDSDLSNKLHSPWHSVRKKVLGQKGGIEKKNGIVLFSFIVELNGSVGFLSSHFFLQCRCCCCCSCLFFFCLFTLGVHLAMCVTKYSMCVCVCIMTVIVVIIVITCSNSRQNDSAAALNLPNGVDFYAIKWIRVDNRQWRHERRN